MHATPAVGLHMLGAGQRLQAIGRRVSALEQLTRRPQHGSPHHVRDQAAEGAQPRGARPYPASHRGGDATTQRSSFAHSTSCGMRALRASLWAPNLGGRIVFTPPENNELVLSIETGCTSIPCLFNQHQTPRSDSANLEPSEPLFCPQILEPRPPWQRNSRRPWCCAGLQNMGAQSCPRKK